jgi:hypothetical protein
VNADALSKEDYLNAPGQAYTVKFTTAGRVRVAMCFCMELWLKVRPASFLAAGAGMVGKVVVQ